MSVGIKLRGKFTDIYAKLKADALLHKGMTMEQWIKKERIKRIEEVEMEQFGERPHGINKYIIRDMLKDKEELRSVFSALHFEKDDDKKNVLRKRIEELKESLRILSLSVTVGKTKHLPKWNSLFVYDFISKYYMLSGEQILALIRVATEEDLV